MSIVPVALAAVPTDEYSSRVQTAEIEMDYNLKMLGQQLGQCWANVGPMLGQHFQVYRRLAKIAKSLPLLRLVELSLISQGHPTKKV